MKPRICHITSAHERYDSRIFQRECKFLSKMGYDVYLIVNDEKRNEIKFGVKIISTGKKYISRKERLFQGVNSVYLEAMKINADIYQLHDPELLRIALRIKRNGKNVIFDSHENYREQIKEKKYIPKWIRKGIVFLYGCFENYIVKRIDGVIMPCPMIKRR